MLKRHLGKIISLSGIAVMLFLPDTLGPWITSTLYTRPLPDGSRILFSPTDAIAGPAMCGVLGVAMLLGGLAYEMVQAFKEDAARRKGEADGR